MRMSFKKFVAAFLAVLSIVSVCAIPSFAAIGYPMECTVYYKDESGNTLAKAKTFTADATDGLDQSTGVASPSIDGYALKYAGDSFVTYGMMDKSFPPSNYVRHGTATYTVVYVKVYTHTVYYNDGTTRNRIASPKTFTGAAGKSFTIASPTIIGYTPTKINATGTIKTSNTSEVVYYYEKTYTISYDANGGSGAPASQTKAHTKNLTLSSTKPTRTGYSFLGWGTSASGSAQYQPGTTYTANGDVTLYAIWTPNKYTVSFNANGGSGAPSSQTKYHGMALTLSTAKPTRSGYTFAGWATYASATSAAYQPGSSYTGNYSLTLYAVWSKNAATYTVSYNANGGSGAPGSQTKTENVTLTLSSTRPTRTNYTFLGWATSRTATSATYSPGGSYTANASVTLYAVWSCNHPTTTQKYITDCDWAKVCDICGKTISTGTSHGPYTYGEWVYYSATQHKRTKNCSHGDYSTAEYGNHSTTVVYEEYSGSQHKYYDYCTVCGHMVGSAKYGAHNMVTKTENGVVTKTCTQCGYTQTDKQTYNVSYDANGGSGAPARQTKVHDVTLTLSSVKPTRAGYTFMGWAKSRTATSATYSAGGSYTANAGTTLYAVWACTHPTTTRTFATTCQWKDVCTVCGATVGTGTTHAELEVSAWQYYNATQHSRTKKCPHGDFSTVEYANHTLTTIFEPDGPDQHKYYSYCTECQHMVGSEHTEPHDYKVTTQNGKRHYSCELCGFGYDEGVTYTVVFDANGGTGAPGTQLKTHDVTLVLSTKKPTRTGYVFEGWATSRTATVAVYAAGGNFNSNANTVLYAVWRNSGYTVSYDANGGSGAPSAQNKTHGVDLTLSTVIPSRNGYTFLGWATTNTATTVAYTAGATYTNNVSVTLYAVWQEINYDFSVSDLKITPEIANQYSKVTVNFRLDSWDRYNAYSDIPVVVYLDSTEVYSGKVSFVANGVNYFTFDLNTGALEGTHTLEARVNWTNRGSESRTTNNSAKGTFEVQKAVDLSAGQAATGGEYYEGCEVVSSFFVKNEGTAPILPSDHLAFEFVVSEVNGATETEVYRKTWTDVVVPANEKNLVYFKWTVPAGSAGKQFICKGTVKPAGCSVEQNPDNNTSFFTFSAKSMTFSVTPDTRYEREAPATYTPGASAPATKTGSASWNIWEYENGDFVLKTYGIRVNSGNPTVAPDPFCQTASMVSGKWTMGSGYGYSLTWNPQLVTLSGSLAPSADSYTGVQAAYVKLPEYGYQGDNGKYETLQFVSGKLNFRQNPDADGNARIHFIPVYVADGNYIASVTVTQIWTPAGVITATRNANTIVINGTIYDDWYQG